MEQSLRDFIKNNTKFLKLEDGEIFQGTFHGFKVIPNRFHPEDNTVQYQLKFVDGERTIKWENDKNYVATAMQKLKEGDLVQIKREGTEKKTKYIVEPITKDKIVIEDEVPF
jgi:hypothetical protein